MSMAGLSKSRLDRMHEVLSGYVERKDMPGLVALVSRHDDAHVEALGAMSFGQAAPMNSTNRSSLGCRNLQNVVCCSPSPRSPMTRYLRCVRSPCTIC
jgi:hypothetical protein